MKKIILISLCMLFIASCEKNDTNKSDATESEINAEILARLTFPEQIKQSQQGSLRAPATTTIYNPEAVIPPQCYTKHEQQYNPCMTCHQTYPYRSRPNQMNDAGLQKEYAFSDFGLSNHWSNLFEDRMARMKEISDQAVIDYIYTDNYTPLIEQLKSTTDWQGPIPEITNLQLASQAFDKNGIAKDGSYWVAFNYKPLPSTFWATNGSTDDVMIRLPESFRNSACSNSYSRDTYLANLSILEATIKDLDTISVPSIDESKVCADLNQDGKESLVTEIVKPDFYMGKASNIPVVRMLYPKGTEFLHTVRYVGVSSEGSIINPPRMKEVRYMKKIKFLSEQQLASRYGKELQEKIDELLPSYVNRGDAGSDNGFGWMVQGFIEGKEGHLRLQNKEETLFCMGCHSTIGSTIDKTFAFPRKVTGAPGWQYINLKGMKDAPNINGADKGEILHYLNTVGGGNEFRENPEIIQRFFTGNGSVDEAKVLKSDVYTLTTPSIRRALELNKAYMTIVQDQDYIQGRDANLNPVKNVHKSVSENTPVLPIHKLQKWDIRLNWSE